MRATPIIGLALCVVAGAALAADVPGNLQARLARVEAVAAAAQPADSDLTTVAANKPVYTERTTAMQVVGVSGTNGQTVAFAMNFDATPKAVCGYAAGGVITNQPSYSAIATNSITLSGDEGKTINAFVWY